MKDSGKMSGSTVFDTPTGKETPGQGSADKGSDWGKLKGNGRDLSATIAGSKAGPMARG